MEAAKRDWLGGWGKGDMDLPHQPDKVTDELFRTTTFLLLWKMRQVIYRIL